MIARRVASSVSPAAPVGSSTILGSSLAELPFFYYGLVGSADVGCYPVGSSGVTVSAVRGFVLIPSATSGRTVTVELWKMATDGTTEVDMHVGIQIPADNAAVLRTSGPYTLVEGEMLFSRLSTDAFDAFHVSWVVEF